MKQAIVLLAHGARDPEWARPLEAIAERVRALAPDQRVVLAYLELMSPSLEQAVTHAAREGARDIKIVPVFLAQGGHVKRDLPEKVALLASQLAPLHPNFEIKLLAAIGEQPEVIAAIAASIATLTR